MNLEKLDEAIAHAEAHPEGHSQAFYFARGFDCGSTACLAGIAALLAGWRPVWTDADVWEPEDDSPGGRSTSTVERDGEQQDVYVVAKDILGLTDRQAGNLFVFSGSLDCAKRYRDEIAAGES
jgi:hypothetical protein